VDFQASDKPTSLSKYCQPVRLLLHQEKLDLESFLQVGYVSIQVFKLHSCLFGEHLAVGEACSQLLTSKLEKLVLSIPNSSQFKVKHLQVSSRF